MRPTRRMRRAALQPQPQQPKFKPNANAEPIHGVAGNLHPIPRQALRTHVVRVRCPACGNDIGCVVSPDDAQRWEARGQLGMVCGECGQRFAAGRGLVSLK